MAYHGPKLSELKGPARRKRIAELAANPATRAAIPDAYLPAKYKTGRADARAGKAQVAPGLTQSDLSKQLKAATDLQFGGQERDLQAQATRIPDWYKQYQDVIAQAQANQQQAGTAAVTGLQGLQSGLDQAAAQQWAGQQQAMSADAANRGATADPKLADIAHNASNIRNALTSGFGAQLLGQALAEQGFLGNRAGVAAQQGVEALGRNAASRQELGRQKADFQTTQRANLIKAAQDAHTTAVNNALNTALKKATYRQAGIRIKDAEKNAAFDRHRWNQQTNTTYGLSNGAVVQLRRTPEGRSQLEQLKGKQDKLLHPPKAPKTVKPVKPVSGPGSLSSAEEQKRLERVRKIAQYFLTGVSQQSTDANGKVVTTRVAAPRDVVSVKTWLRQQGVDPVAIRIGEDLYRNGGSTLGPDGLSQAHKYGIHVGGNFKVTTGKGPGRNRPT